MARTVPHVQPDPESAAAPPPLTSHGVERTGTRPFFGDNHRLREIHRLATLAAASEAIVLLEGETGTGKGMLANWIHRSSGRADQSFVEVNCSSLQQELLSTELFGHARGAFTSAVQSKPGLVEAANRGTLFLDEIASTSQTVQAQILKVIEDRTFRRLGETRLRHSDFRLICATNTDLADMARQGRFRADLFFRINIFPIQLPPLREIRDTIPGLVLHLLQDMEYPHQEVSGEVATLLAGHPFPGNIRELRNLLERAAILAGGGPMTGEHFPSLSGRGDGATPGGPTIGLRAVEATHIRAVLQRHGQDKRATAKALGISLATLYRKLKRMADL